MNNFNTPLISVIMPVYNAELYLDEAISSILKQSYDNLELIIINDGSTDSSLSIIEKYAGKDIRIRLKSRKNGGYVSALNEAIDMSAGKYIARMDADDISSPQRLQRQVEYMSKHPDCVALFTRIQPIDENGKEIEDWQADKNAITYTQIKNLIVIENCLAHPTLMIRASVLKSYRYDETQAPSEDYDLWLRLLSNKLVVNKLKHKLLSYRVHSKSVSQMSIHASSTRRKYLNVKSRFLYKQIRHGSFGVIELRISMTLAKLITVMAIYKIRHYIRHSVGNLRRLLHKITKVGSIQFRKIVPRRKRVLLVVPWVSMGGADKVFLDIVKGLHSKRFKISCITTFPSENEWKPLFEKYCEDVIDATEESDADNIAWFIVQYVTNNQFDIVLISNTIVGYVAAQAIKERKPEVMVYDIIHGQGGKEEDGGMPKHSTQFDKCIDKRIVVTEYMKHYLVDQYGIDADKIKVIHNGIELPKKIPKPAKEFYKLKGKFIVLWAGRFNIEKHPELVVEIARTLMQSSSSIHFIMAGEGYMRNELLSLIKEYGLNNITVTQRPYSDPMSYMPYSNALLMTSEMEGLPIVILEAFSAKIPVVAPNVGGIPEVVDDSNGYLINYDSEFVNNAAAKIVQLEKDVKLAKKMGREGYYRVQNDFSLRNMVDLYIEALDLKINLPTRRIKK